MKNAQQLVECEAFKFLRHICNSATKLFCDDCCDSSMLLSSEAPVLVVLMPQILEGSRTHSTHRQHLAAQRDSALDGDFGGGHHECSEQVTVSSGRTSFSRDARCFNQVGALGKDVLP